MSGEAAQEALRLGEQFGVVPVPLIVQRTTQNGHDPDKRVQPLARYGHLDGQPFDISVYEQLWRDHQDAAGLGIRAPWLAQVEADSPEAEERLRRMRLPRTWTARSPGGIKYFFRAVADVEPYADGHVEVKGVKSLHVIPPTPSYSWLPSLSPYDVDLAPFPEQLRRAARTTTPRSEPLPEILAPGHRREQLLSLAGAMRRKGAGTAEILAALQAANERRCRPPLGDDEVRAIAGDVAQRYEPEVDGRRPDLPEPASLAELLTGELPTVEFAIPNLAPRGMVTTFYASVGAGKSVTYSDAVVANALRRSFLGLFPMADGDQVFVVFDWENGPAATKTVLRRLGLTSENVRNTYYYFDTGARVVNLDTEAGRDRVRRILERHGATCAIFDSRDAAFPNTPEIEAEKIRPAMEGTLQIARDLHTAMLLVSHEPKADYADSASKLRGHTAWGQHSEQMFRLRRHGDARVLEHTKNRTISRRPSLKLVLNVEGDPDRGPMVLSAEVQESQAEKANRRSEDAAAVEAILDDQGDLRWGELRSATGWPDSRLRAALNESARVWQAEARKPYSTRDREEPIWESGS